MVAFAFLGFLGFSWVFLGFQRIYLTKSGLTSTIYVERILNNYNKSIENGG